MSLRQRREAASLTQVAIGSSKKAGSGECTKFHASSSEDDEGYKEAIGYIKDEELVAHIEVAKTEHCQEDEALPKALQYRCDCSYITKGWLPGGPDANNRAVSKCCGRSGCALTRLRESAAAITAEACQWYADRGVEHRSTQLQLLQDGGAEGKSKVDVQNYGSASEIGISVP